MQNSKDDRHSTNLNVVKEITPIKNSSYQLPNSTGGKTNPLSNGYASKFLKRRGTTSSKSKTKSGKYIKRKVDTNQIDGRSKSVSSQKNRNIESDCNSSIGKVVDLKEARNIEKQKRQSKVSGYDTRLQKMISFTNFSQLSENYAANLNNLRNWDKSKDYQIPMTITHKAQKEKFLIKDRDLNSHRSHWNLTHQHDTYSDTRLKHESLTYDAEHHHFESKTSKTQEKVPNGILQLRKQMLNQEYEDLEKQKLKMRIPDFSPQSFETNKMSEYGSTLNIAEEYSDVKKQSKAVPNESITPK